MLSTSNTVLDAVFASLSIGCAGEHPADVNAPSLTFPSAINGRTSDKFAMGFLGGYGGTSQFASQSQLLPVLPPASNRDLEQRIAASRGIPTGERLLSWHERPRNFNPGLGTDTWRDGDNVTWTLSNRGEMSDVPSGVAGPIAYQALDRTDRDGVPPFHPRAQGLDPMIRGPVVLCTSLAAPVGHTLAEMQAAGGIARRKAALHRAKTLSGVKRKRA